MEPRDNRTYDEATRLEAEWASSSRWRGTVRAYTAEEVLRLRPSICLEYTLARRGAERLWEMLTSEPFVATFGALTGSQAVQMVRAGLKSIYVSGWQTAADANLAYQTYPDQSLYPSNSVPMLVRRINNALMRADLIDRIEGRTGIDWYVPVVADAEAGFGGPLHSFELTKALIEAGAAGIHLEDQLASEKKCGHLGGKVLVPTSQFIRTLTAARLAADTMGVPTVLIARTDALDATMLTNDADDYDLPYITGERTPEGYFLVRNGLEAAIARALAYAPYADALWFETSRPDLDEARRFAEAVHAEYPGKILAYNCSPSFHWKLHLGPEAVESFQRELAGMGYKFQFITLAGWHLINYFTFRFAREYRTRGMSAYVELQELEFSAEREGYTAVRHQQEVGVRYFDEVLLTISRGSASTLASAGSTEAEQFQRSEKRQA